MKRVRKKRIMSIDKQIGKHKDKIEKEEGRFDTTKEYWSKEIHNKFEKQKREDEKYLEEN